MEEDIKILEELFGDVELTIGGWVERLDKKEKQALENLIKGYQEKEESEKYLYEAYQDAGKKMFEYAEQLEDSVPKSKIKEKIEELEKVGKVKNITFGSYGQYIYQDKIDALQELMEDK